MKPYKMLKEESDHFVIDEGDGKPYKVAKGPLAHKTVERIRKHFSGASGDPQDQLVTSDPDPTDSGLADLIGGTKADKQMMRDRWNPPRGPEGGVSSTRVVVQPQDESHPPDVPLWSPERGLLPSIGDAAKAGAGVIADGLRKAAAPLAAQATNGIQNLMGVPAPAAPPGATPQIPEMLQRPPDQAPAAPQQQVPQQQPMPGAPAGLAAAGKEQQAAVQDAAGVQARGMLQLADKMDSQNIGMQDFDTKKAAATAAYVKSLDDQFKWLQNPDNQKIQPNRVWANASGPQKAAAVFGLILGGIGGALTRSPNAALQILDKQIDNDIDAQKATINTKRGVFRDMLDRFKDVQAADHMTRATMLNDNAAALQALATRSGVPEVIARANGAIAELKQKMIEQIQLGTGRALQLEGEKTNLAVQRQTQEAMGQLLRGVSGGGGFNRQILEMPAFKDYRERAVDLPDGSVGFASDKEQANQATESMAVVSRLKSKLARYADLLKSGNPATLDRGSAQGAYADLLSEIGHLHDLKRLTDKDLELFKEQVPDISALTTLKPFSLQKLSGLGKSIDDKVWSVNQQILHRPQGGRPQ